LKVWILGTPPSLQQLVVPCSRACGLSKPPTTPTCQCTTPSLLSLSTLRGQGGQEAVLSNHTIMKAPRLLQDSHYVVWLILRSNMTLLPIVCWINVMIRVNTHQFGCFRACIAFPSVEVTQNGVLCCCCV